MTAEERFESIERNLNQLTAIVIQNEERHDREISAIRAQLRRAIRVGVQEARAERARRRELDERLSLAAAAADGKLTQLAAAQLVTEEKLQRLLDFRSTNGKP